MFCYQCEQTAKGEACTKAGVCGKPQDVATLQDLLVYALIGLSIAASEARRKGIGDHDADVFTVKALFSTLTNVNFDPERFVPMIKQAVKFRDGLIGKLKASGGSLDLSIDALAFKPSGTLEGLLERGKRRADGLPGGKRRYPLPEAHAPLRHKGARRLRRPCPDPGPGDTAVYAFVQEGLAALADEKLGLEGPWGLCSSAARSI